MQPRALGFPIGCIISKACENLLESRISQTLQSVQIEVVHEIQLQIPAELFPVLYLYQAPWCVPTHIIS